MNSIHFTQTPQPDTGELGSQIVSLLSISLMTALFGIKTYQVDYRHLTPSRWLVLALYIFSWSFIVSSTILVSTNNDNHLSCYLSILSCDIFYAATKLTIYAWLIEKVWVVSSLRKKRWDSLQYRIHCFLLVPYVAILALMIVYHNAEMSETGQCVIGLAPIASIPLLTYDFTFNLYMTILFVTPLVRLGKSVQENWRVSRLNEVARRTLVASVVCLLVSFANILAIVILDGRERGVLCLTCCTVDVTINVGTIHWVTTHTMTKIKAIGHELSLRVDQPQSENQYPHRVDSKNDIQSLDQPKYTPKVTNLGITRPFQSRYVTIADLRADTNINDSHVSSSIQGCSSSQKSLASPSL